MTIEIKDRYTERVIYSSDKAKDLREAVLEAVGNRADLSGADLSGAYLSGAYLSGAYLSGASLRSADLRSASLSGAYLSGADLSGASLSGADLSGADLSGASLSGADLSGASLRSADLRSAYLSGADLSGASLSGADLRSASLRSASLSGADLRSADLSGASLSGASLRSADLSGASLRSASLSGSYGINKHLVQPLLLLLNQPGKLRFYKAVTTDLKSPTHHVVIQYEIGKRVSVDNADTDDTELCGAGINVATLDWILKEYGVASHYRIIIIECTANDIACIPTASDGKIRLWRGKVVGELDYERYGLNDRRPAATNN